MTEEQLKQVCTTTPMSKIKIYVQLFNQYMPQYDINTPLRICHFISQVAHESLCLFYTKEIASGKAYEGRIDLGNVNEGDGVCFKGRGLIQLTGRTNYEELSKEFGIDAISMPELIEQPEWAVRSACWFWKKKGLNQLADLDDIIKVTKKINGGLTGLEDRKRLYELCKQTFME